MDFALTDEQTEVAALATRIFGDRLTAETRKHVEASGDRFDDALWAQLAGAGLLGVALGDDVGGAGHGLLELCALLTTAGAAAAPVPLWAVLCTGALPVERFGSVEQRKAVLPDVVRGSRLVVGALDEPAGGDLLAPGTRATRDGSGWRLDGVKTCVPAAHRAARLVVSATADDGEPGLWLVDPASAGVTIERQVSTTGAVHGLVTLAAVRVTDRERLGPPGQGRAILAWTLERAAIGACAMQLGLCEQVLKMTAAYTSQRVQFDRPIATFQAVAQRAADAYVDVESIRLTLWEAAWRLTEGLPAARHVAIAKATAAECGQRVTYAAQHLHGGIGFDLDYPLAKFYPLAKQLELALGGASAHLARLGAELAAE